MILNLERLMQHKQCFHVWITGTNLPTWEINHLFLERLLINLEVLETD